MRYLYPGKRDGLESKAAVLKVSHLFHWPGSKASATQRARDREHFNQSPRKQ